MIKPAAVPRAFESATTAVVAPKPPSADSTSPSESVSDQFILDTEKRLETLQARVDSLQHQVNELLQRRRDSRPRLLQFFRHLTTPRLWSLVHYPPRPMVISPPYLSSGSRAATPSISIITPSLNQGEFIERTIGSIVGQRYPNLQYIVQDACSKDETYDILKRYENEVGIEVVVESDGGQADAIQRASQRSTGEIMGYVNADDMLLPGTLHYVCDYFARHPDVDVVYGHRVIIDANDQEVGRWIMPPHSDNVLKWADYIPQETMFWRRRIWDKVAGIDRSFGFALDWDLIMRFIDAGAKFKRLPRFLGAFRLHEAQKTQQLAYCMGAAEMRQIRERYVGYNPTMSEIHRRLFWFYFVHLCCHFGYRLGWLRY